MYNDLVQSLVVWSIHSPPDKFGGYVQWTPTEFYAYEGFTISVKIRGWYFAYVAFTINRIYESYQADICTVKFNCKIINTISIPYPGTNFTLTGEIQVEYDADAVTDWSGDGLDIVAYQQWYVNFKEVPDTYFYAGFTEYRIAVDGAESVIVHHDIEKRLHSDTANLSGQVGWQGQG